jgi:hypothetical protein
VTKHPEIRELIDLIAALPDHGEFKQKAALLLTRIARELAEARHSDKE